MKLKSRTDLVHFIRATVPDLLERHMFLGYTLKSCSGVAPSFTHLARKAGFNALTVHNGYHYYNLVETRHGVFHVDLSEIQFSSPPYGTDEYYDFVDEVARKARRDPLSIVAMRKTEEFMPNYDAYRMNEDSRLHEERMNELAKKRRGLLHAKGLRAAPLPHGERQRSIPTIMTGKRGGRYVLSKKSGKKMYLGGKKGH